MDYRVTLHRSVRRFLRSHPDLQEKWDEIVNQIRSNPRAGRHIDHLKGPWNCSYRWDEGSYRIKYEVLDSEAELHFYDANNRVYDANNRGDAYSGRRGAGRRR